MQQRDFHCQCTAGSSPLFSILSRLHLNLHGSTRFTDAAMPRNSDKYRRTSSFLSTSPQAFFFLSLSLNSLGGFLSFVFSLFLFKSYSILPVKQIALIVYLISPNPRLDGLHSFIFQHIVQSLTLNLHSKRCISIRLQVQLR